PLGGFVRLANAGHPFPVHYSSRRAKCDILPLRGEVLNDPYGKSSTEDDFEAYALAIQPTDVLVFVSDGITEDHVIHGDAYGYRFTGIVEEMHAVGARAIGESILEDWKAHSRDEDAGDDVTIVVVALNGGNSSDSTLHGGAR